MIILIFAAFVCCVVLSALMIRLAFTPGWPPSVAFCNTLIIFVVAAATFAVTAGIVGMMEATK